MPDFEGAVEEMKRLKRKAPQFDFVVYAPYPGSSSHAIMMATWVSRPVAEEALKDAKQYVSKGSLIWTCRSKGSSC